MSKDTNIFSRIFGKKSKASTAGESSSAGTPPAVTNKRKHRRGKESSFRKKTRRRISQIDKEVKDVLDIVEKAGFPGEPISGVCKVTHYPGPSARNILLEQHHIMCTIRKKDDGTYINYSTNRKEQCKD
jgi:hypothetical protein